MGCILKSNIDDQLRLESLRLESNKLAHQLRDYKIPHWSQYRNFLPEYLDSTFDINIETQVAQTILSFLDVLPHLPQTPPTQPNLTRFIFIGNRNSCKTTIYNQLLLLLDDKLQSDVIEHLEARIKKPVRTTGIITNEYDFYGHKIQIIDVGFTRNEKRKVLRFMADYEPWNAFFTINIDNWRSDFFDFDYQDDIWLLHAFKKYHISTRIDVLIINLDKLPVEELDLTHLRDGELQLTNLQIVEHLVLNGYSDNWYGYKIDSESDVAFYDVNAFDAAKLTPVMTNILTQRILQTKDVSGGEISY